MLKLDSILYVEDDKATQEELSRFLNRFCDNLYLANNGKKALEIFKENKIDLIISDINMPVMDGISFIYKAKEIVNEQAIIFTTAYGEIKYLQEAINLQANAYVIKPIDLDSLENKIETIIFMQNWEKIQLKKKQEQETILETSSDGLAITDKNSNFIYVNRAFENLLGYTKEELYKIKSIDISKKDEFEESLKNINKDSQNEKGKIFHKVYKNKLGEDVIVSLNSSIMPDGESLLIAVRDITKEKEKERLLNNYLEIVDDNVITSTTDLEGKIVSVSEAFCKISGYTKKELIGSSHNIIRHPDTESEVFKDLWQTIKSNKTWTGEIKNKKKNGDFYWENTIINPVYDLKGDKIGYTAIKHDITNKKYIEIISRIDPLTKIYNRRYFDENFNVSIKRSKRENNIFSFIMIDIDFFKQYNDLYGHQAGDEVLKKVSSTINNSLKRANDYCCRLGGEEFSVSFESLNIDKSIEFAQIIKSNIDKLKIEHKGSLISDFISVSMGLLIIEPNKNIQIDNAYKIADTILYKAKNSGRNQLIYEVF